MSLFVCWIVGRTSKAVGTFGFGQSLSSDDDAVPRSCISSAQNLIAPDLECLRGTSFGLFLEIAERIMITTLLVVYPTKEVNCARKSQSLPLSDPELT